MVLHRAVQIRTYFEAYDLRFSGCQFMLERSETPARTGVVG